MTSQTHVSEKKYFILCKIICANYTKYVMGASDNAVNMNTNEA